jgi:hypothetical protein
MPLPGGAWEKMPKPMLGYCRSGGRAGSLYATVAQVKPIPHTPAGPSELTIRCVCSPIFPFSIGVARYDRQTLTSDIVAAIIVTIMLIPQSLAYALLAGLPPEVGLYASVLPLVAYAMFGTSTALAVGPVAVDLADDGRRGGSRRGRRNSVDYASAAIVLALLSGVSC